jgi:hypothetical protein
MPFGTRSERRRRYTFIGIEPYAIGAAISAIVGYASIYLIGLVIKGKFYIFAFYCLQ